MNKKMWKIRRIITVVLMAAIITGLTVWYGIPHLYASQEEKTLRVIQQSQKILESIMENYIDKISQLDPMGNHTYEGAITVSECVYDGVDYRPDAYNRSQKYSIVTTNNNIVLDMPKVKDGTLVVDKNDILKYGLAKIDSSQTKPILRAALTHVMEGYKVAVKDSATISDKALIAGVNTFVEEMYKDPVILPYISLFNVHGITADNMKSRFSEYAKGVYTTYNISLDSQDRLTGIELVFNRIGADANTAGDYQESDNNKQQIGNINISFTGEDQLYDSMQIMVTTAVINNNYVNVNLQLDMQDMNNIKYGIAADISYRSHSLKLKADGDIRKN